MCVDFQVKRRTLIFFYPNLLKNEFCDRNFKNLGADSKSAPPKDHVCQFLVKKDNSQFFGLHLGKLPSYVRCFNSNNVGGVTESWVETEMSWVAVGA